MYSVLMYSLSRFEEQCEFMSYCIYTCVVFILMQYKNWLAWGLLTFSVKENVEKYTTITYRLVTSQYGCKLQSSRPCNRPYVLTT